MGISTVGHLPAVTSTSYPTLLTWLQATHGAHKVSSWSVTIRILRAHAEDGNSASQELKASPRNMYVVQMSEFPEHTFVLAEDLSKPTRAEVRVALNTEARRVAVEEEARKTQYSENKQDTEQDTSDPTSKKDIKEDDDVIMIDGAPSTSAIASEQSKLQSIKQGFTRQTMFTASEHFLLLLSRLNLPPALGATTTNTNAAGPGAWLFRGSPLVIQGHTYDMPSTSEAHAGGLSGTRDSSPGEKSEWRVRIGMIQSSGSRGSGALVESEYLPLSRVANEAFLVAHLQGLFPLYLLDPSQNTAAATGTGLNGTVTNGPLSMQWDEIIPASHDSWLDSVEKASHQYDGLSYPIPFHTHHDKVGWRGLERGRRLAYFYITLLRNQGVL